MSQARFALGTCVATPGALEALAEAGQTAMEFLARHQAGDWGDVSPADTAINEASLHQGTRLMSV